VAAVCCCDSLKAIQLSVTAQETKRNATCGSSWLIYPVCSWLKPRYLLHAAITSQHCIPLLPCRLAYLVTLCATWSHQYIITTSSLMSGYCVLLAGWSALPCCSALMQLLLSRGQHAIAGQQQQQQQLQQQQDTLPLDQQRRSTCESSSPQPSPAQALAACALPHLAQQSTTSQLTTWQQPLLYSQAMGLRTQAGRGTGSNHRRQQQQQQQQRQQEHRTQQHRPQQQQQQQQEQLRHQVAEPSAAELTALIMEADSPRELLQSVVANHQHINHIHIIAALNRATALWPTTATPSHPLTAPHTPRLSHIQPQQQQPSGDSKVQLVERQQLEVLMQQLSQPLVRALPRYSAREITSALWSYAQCGLRPPPEVLHECVNNVCSWDKLREVGLGGIQSDVCEGGRVRQCFIMQSCTKCVCLWGV